MLAQACPTQEDVAGRLHEALPADNSVAVVAIGTVSNIRFQHRFLSFFHLQEERIVVMAGIQQHHEATGGDASNPDHLEREIQEAVALHELATVILQGR